MGDLSGKKALITGGCRGIGAVVVRRLVAEGVAVAVSYRSNAERARKLVRELDSETTRVVAIQADVTDPNAIRELAATAVEKLGGLDIAISNGGIGHFAALQEITADDFARVFDTNVRGQLFVAKAAAAHLPPGGRIVLTSSASTRASVRHHTLYAASKAAVSTVVSNLALEFAERDITINAVFPGGTETDMAKEHSNTFKDFVRCGDSPVRPLTTIGRLAQPREIAAAVAFLVSPDAPTSPDRRSPSTAASE